MATLRKVNVAGSLYDLGLSDSELNKLASIPAGAQANVIEAIKLNGKVLTVEDKTVDIVVDTSVFKVVQTLPEAPDAADANKVFVVPKGASTEQIGDMYNEYIYTNGEWELVGSVQATVDLSNYVQKEAGKGLSSNDYTDADKAQLAANTERIEQVASNANKTTFAVADGTLTITTTEVPAKQ